MRHFFAIFRKQLMDTFKNKTILIQFVMFPALTLIMENIVKMDDMPPHYFANLFAVMYIGMAPLTAMSAILSEEKEKNTLRVLLLSNVSPFSYLGGTGCYIWLICMAGGAVIGAGSGYTGTALLHFLLAMAVGILISILIGAAIGTWSKNQMTDPFIEAIPQFEPISEEISFSRKKSTGNASYAYHRHDGCEVYLFLSGNIRLYIEQSCFSPVTGSLVLLNSNEMHRIQCMDDTPYERIVINLKRSYINELSPSDVSLEDCFYARPCGSGNLRVLSSEALQEFLSLYRGLEASAAPDCYGHTVARNAYASLLLLFLNKQFQAAPAVCKNTMPPYII